MKKIIFISILTFSIFNQLKAQQISLSFQSFPGIAYSGNTGAFYGGGGLELAYQQDYKKGRIRTALAYRTIDWGNQIALNTGYNLPYFSRNQWRVSGTSELHLGLALFREKPLFTWAVGYLPELEWQSKKRFFTSLSFGILYTNSPKYRQFSDINSVVELPFKIACGFRLGK